LCYKHCTTTGAVSLMHAYCNICFLFNFCSILHCKCRSQDTHQHNTVTARLQLISYIKRTLNVISVNCQPRCQAHLSTSLCYVLCTDNNKQHVFIDTVTCSRRCDIRVTKLSNLVRSVCCGQLIWSRWRSYNSN